MSALTQPTLFGSLTSPYTRLCRLVRTRSGADAAVAFERADPFDEEFRAQNPLGKVPALIIPGGAACLETTLIVRTLLSLGPRDLLPSGADDRRQAEADMALMMGLLDLGVAHRLESLRPQELRSTHWQDRRAAGLKAALPLLEAAAARASTDEGGAAALALVSTTDWLDFRLAEVLDWRSACPAAASLTDKLLSQEDIAATDPR